MTEPPGLERRATGLFAGSAWQRKLFVASVAVALTVIAVAMRMLFLQPLGMRNIFLTFFPAVILASLYGGWWAGLLATLLSALAADYFFIAPAGHFKLEHPADWLSIGIFLLSCGLIVVLAEVMHRSRARAAAATARAHLAAIVESSEDAIVSMDLEGTILSWNTGAVRIFGYRPEEMIGKSIRTLVPPERQNEEDDLLARLGRGERMENIETVRLAKDGRRLDVSLSSSPLRDESGRITGTSKILRDIGERKKREIEQQRLNRTHKALSDSNQAMVRAIDEAGLLAETCRIIVEDCGHAMVWIGFAENDAGKTIRPVASAGFDQGYLETLSLTWADTERGRGPTGTAIRTGQVCSCRNMLTDPKFAPWRDEAARRGYASSIVLPLMDGARAFGALTIYSRETDPFSDDEIQLLSELANDLAYGIIMLRLRTERRDAEQALAKSEARLRLAQESAMAGTWEWDLRTGANYWSDDLWKLYGLDPKSCEPSYASWLLSVRPEHRTHVEKAVQTAARQGTDLNVEWQVNTPGTEERWLMSRGRPERDASGRIVRYLGIVLDITDRKRAEENRRLTAEALNILNGPGEMAAQIGSLVKIIRNWGGYDAVGMRLQNSEDFPYYVQEGFSDDFVRAESSLCARGCGGALIHDEVGRPVLECTCGLVLSGRFDPASPLLSEGGSFWTNEASALLKLRPENDPRTKPRNRCMTVGYESVALIPLKTGGEIIGLLQINDCRKGRFTPETIRFFEGLADNISIALARRRTEEALSRSNRRSELLARTAGELLRTSSPQSLIEGLCSEVMSFLECQVFFNYLVDEGSGRLHLNSCAGIPAEEARKIEWLDYGVAVCGCVARDGCRIVAEDIFATAAPRTDLVRSYGIQAYACHPLMARDRVLGTLSFGTRNRLRFSEAELAMMKTVADLVSIAINRKQTEQILEQHRDHLEDLVRERSRELSAKTEQLQQAQKMEAIGRLAGGVAHDFNNLMQVIAGFARRTVRDMPVNDPRRANVEEVVNASERATGLTRQLLAFSRRQILQPTVLDLNAVIENMIKLLARLLGEDVEVRMQLAANLPRIMADRVQIEQVIMNLAANARDAMPRGGLLTIETSAVTVGPDGRGQHELLSAGRYALLSITDTGCGMTEEVRAHIFEPFFTTKSVGAGTGLGLATVYGVVQQSGGTIGVSSAPGQGTTFNIYFPASSEPAAGNGSAIIGDMPMERGNETILLVEDEASLRSLVAMELRDLGYKVLEARNIGEAITAAEGSRNKIDLVLTDVVLPGVSGPSLYAMLNERLPGMKVIFMSGHTEKHIVHQGVLDPGTAFLAKPFTAEALASKIREVLGTKN